MFGKNRFEGFGARANAAISCAVRQAARLGESRVGSKHLLFGLIKEGGGTACLLLREQGIDERRLRERLAGKGSESARLTAADMTANCRRIIDSARAQARLLGAEADTDHLFLAMLRLPECGAVSLLKALGCNVGRCLSRMTMSVGAENTSGHGEAGYGAAATFRSPGRTPMLERYGRDVTAMARLGRLDPVIGREWEIERVMRILSRRTKNNPCLVGEAGVGKTAIVEGLAQRIQSGDAPDTLRGRRIVSADISGMVAGAKYRGDFEERIRGCIEEAVREDVILFIDELHGIVGAGAAEGAVDGAGILKPMLARGELRVIGATTFDEYARYIARDPALERRFQSVTVEEPDEKACIGMLEGLRGQYEAHHGIRISDEAIEAAVRLSVRYLPERRLPDKALDLIDEACAGMRLARSGRSGENALTERKNRLAAQRSPAMTPQDPKLAASLRDKARPPEPGFPESSGVLTAVEVERQVESSLGLEPGSVNASGELLRLEERFAERVIGQEKAIRAVAGAVRRGRAGLCRKERPTASFLFLGPSGVGKTELAKAMACVVFGSRRALIRLDMSEYMEKHAVSRLVGAPPGYVGFEEGGKLTEEIRRRPSSVVLFDEIEKAHPDIASILLQILDEGRLTDSRGRTASFGNAIVVVTSNIGAGAVDGRGKLGFTGADGEDAARERVLAELRSLLPGELINRFDEIVVFSALGHEQLKRIAEKQLGELACRLGENGYRVEFPNGLAARIVLDSEKKSGARGINQSIRRKVEEPLAEMILSGRIKRGESFRFQA